MSKISYCLGGRHYSKTINETQTEKINPRTKRTIQIIKGQCVICNGNKSRILTK